MCVSVKKSKVEIVEEFKMNIFGWFIAGMGALALLQASFSMIPGLVQYFWMIPSIPEYIWHVTLPVVLVGYVLTLKIDEISSQNKDLRSRIIQVEKMNHDLYHEINDIKNNLR